MPSGEYILSELQSARNKGVEIGMNWAISYMVERGYISPDNAEAEKQKLYQWQREEQRKAEEAFYNFK